MTALRSISAPIKGLLGLLVLTNTSVYVMGNKGLETLNQKGIIGKALAAMATSSTMHRYNQFFVKMLPLEGVPAPEAIQTLGKEALAAVGIPVDRQVSIQYLSGLDDSARAEVNAIIIGDEFVSDKVAHGVKRCNMFHEAVHIKYHDQSFNGVLFFGSLLGAPLGVKLLIKPQRKLKLLYLPAFVAGHYVGRAIQRQFGNYRERRADIEGHYATKCHECLTEKIENMRYLNGSAHAIISYCDHNTELNEEQAKAFAISKCWIEGRKRYLSIEENEIIAAELKRDNKICAFHEQSK